MYRLHLCNAKKSPMDACFEASLQCAHPLRQSRGLEVWVPSRKGAGIAVVTKPAPVPALQVFPLPLCAATACVALDLTDALGKSRHLDLSSFRAFSRLTALRRCAAEHPAAAFPTSKRVGIATDTCMQCRAALPGKARMWQRPRASTFEVQLMST